MKVFLTIILSAFFSHYLYSQNLSSKKVGNQIDKIFTWDIEKDERGTLMYLDVAYQRDNSDSIEYLSLTVAKDKKKQRPEFISVIVPSNVTQSNGIFITFGNIIMKGGKPSMELQKRKPVRINFENCNDEFCTARILNGYAFNDNGNKVDIFQNFLTFKHALFLFIYPDGSHKSVSVPLFSFKEQYKKL